MTECALVFDTDYRTLYVHLPRNRTAGFIPDSPDLWRVLWECRDVVGGVAHIHPWEGQAMPSLEDLTTFDAIQRGLGKLLKWPIVTLNHSILWHDDLKIDWNVDGIVTPLRYLAGKTSI